MALPEYRMGAISFIFIIIAGLVAAFMLVNPERSDIWLAYTATFAIGFGGAAFLIHDKSISFDPSQFKDEILWGFITFFIVMILRIPINIISGSQSALASFSQTDMIALPLLAPASEELLFRGVAFGGFDKFATPKPRSSIESGVVFMFKATPQAAFFGVFHIYAWSLTLSSFFYLYLVGIVYAFAYWKTRSLATPIIAHFLNNGLGVLAMLRW